MEHANAVENLRFISKRFAKRGGHYILFIIFQDKPWKGDKVWVHYTGTLEDGTKFDSSRDRKEKFSFNLGKGEVIKGWDQGVASMVRGELAVFTIHSDFGYGDVGSPPRIPGMYVTMLHKSF